MNQQVMLIQLGETLLQVMPEQSTNYKKDFGYLHEGYVYIYRGKTKNSKTLQSASVYKDDNGKMIWIEPSETEKEDYSAQNVFVMDTESIIQQITDENNLKEVDPTILESTEEFYAPRIEKDDDTLKKLIKLVLSEMKIDVRPKEDDTSTYYITNLKSGLVKNNPMSIKYFSKWCEILKLQCVISVSFINDEGEEDTVALELDNSAYNKIQEKKKNDDDE